MSKITRRLFLLSTAALPIGCATRGNSLASVGMPAGKLRQPAVGQSWRYAKHDLFTGAVVDNQIDTVAAVGTTIDIDSRTEGGKAVAPAGKAAWGMDWLHKYMGTDRVPEKLPSEVQTPWGMVLVDPHWPQLQVYQNPIPLWPEQLRPGWETHITTKYKTPSDSDGLLWQQTMKAGDWETVTVPAGSFRALKYTNSIRFTSTDFGRRDSVRNEVIWFAPEVGRWVIRQSAGTYYLSESVDDTQSNESSYRWELLAWT